MLIARFLQAQFTLSGQETTAGSFFLVMSRHPIAVSFSLRQWSICKHLSLETLIENWLAEHERWKQDISNLKYTFSTKYEELVADPEKVLRKVCAWLGVDFVPSMLEIDEVIVDGNTKYKQEYCRVILSDERFQEAHSSLVQKFERRMHKLGYSLADWGDCDKVNV